MNTMQKEERRRSTTTAIIFKNSENRRAGQGLEATLARIGIGSRIQQRAGQITRAELEAIMPLTGIGSRIQRSRIQTRPDRVTRVALEATGAATLGSTRAPHPLRRNRKP